MGTSTKTFNSPLKSLVEAFLRTLLGSDFDALMRAATDLRSGISSSLPGMDYTLNDKFPRGEGDISYCVAAITMALERDPDKTFISLFNNHYQIRNTYQGVRFLSDLTSSDATLRRRNNALPGVIVRHLTLLEGQAGLNRVQANAADQPLTAAAGIALRRSRLLYDRFGLTPRLAEVLLLVYLNGEMTSSAIARRMGLSPNTIRSHRKKICQKMGVPHLHPFGIDLAHALFLEQSIHYPNHKPKGKPNHGS